MATTVITVNAEATPLVWEWLQNASLDFAKSLRAYAKRHGYLTGNQYGAVLRCIENERAAPVVLTHVDKLMDAFNAATKSKLKHPKLRFEGFNATLAPKSGKNPGAVYLKTESNLYLGKVVDGRFHKSRDCASATQAIIEQTMADPLAAAVAYGKRTGRCTFCNKVLGEGETKSSRESVERGYGPVCAKKFGLL